MDELGEHMWWKRYAMNDALQERVLYRGRYLRRGPLGRNALPT